jgi:hypothetical protein
MPFVYDETQVEWPDDGTEPAPPRPDQFVYIPAPQFGGAREPVRFDVLSFIAPARLSEPEQPSQSHPAAPTEPTREQKRSILERLLGQTLPSGVLPRSRSSQVENRERAKQEQAQRWERLLSIMVPALRQIGGRRVYCRYDGGHDEGWAWFDSLELQDGERVNLDALGERLHDMQVHTEIHSAGFKLHDHYSMRTGDRPSDQGALKSVVNDWLCHEWASMLLGRSFGTGEYSMYGAFTVNLETCTITDDPGADPAVENIRIAP